MELYSSAFGNHPTPPKASGLGVMVATQQEVKNLRVAGSRPRGLGARAPRAWGPAHQGPGAFSPQKPPKLRFFRKPPGGSLAKAWVSAETAASEVGTWRETKPGYPPYPPKEEGFRPLRLRQPSNTPPKVGGSLRTSSMKCQAETPLIPS